MSLDTSGFLLEGIRISSGNNPFSYPPRSVVSDTNAFNSSPGRADYIIFAGGQSDETGMDIGDPSLFFSWSRNDGTVTRFDYDSYSRRWNTLPGSAPEELGVISNTKRLIAPVPDTTATESPYSIYIGSPVRLVTFTVIIVGSSNDFGNPASGSVEISRDKGELNFSQIDLLNVSYQSQSVLLTRQSFFSRSKSKGMIGSLPSSSVSSYSLFLNPIPGLGQVPRIRIGYRPYLNVTSVLTESLLFPPPSGSAVFSNDTGRIVFSPQDIDSYSNSSVYYDGVSFNNVYLIRENVGQISVPQNPPPAIIIGSSPLLVGILDPDVNPILDKTDVSSWGSVAATRFSFFLVPTGDTRRYYFRVVVGDSSKSSLPTPSSNSIVVDSATGSVTVSRNDASKFVGSTLSFVDTFIYMEYGVVVQVFRSSVNESGFSSEPDFTETYYVSDQVVQDGITQSPFILLPTVPLIDPSLKIFVEQASGGGGTFTGELVDGADPSLSGFNYILNLDNKQLKFGSRRDISIVLNKPSSTVKLPDTVVIEDGLEVSVDNSPIEPGVDFDFDPNGGSIEFVDGIGEDDPKNILSISGNVLLPNIFTSTKPVFDTSVVGLFLFISSGPNTGIYPIIGFSNSSEITIGALFKLAESTLADVRAQREVIADRFWSSFSPPLKKFSILKKGTSDVQSNKLGDDEFSVIQTTGQINLASSAKPGDTFAVSYIWQQSNDDGATVIPTPRTDYAAFKVRQESGVASLNSSSIKFNSSGNTVVVSSATPITLYVNNVTIGQSSYQYSAPDTIVISSPLGTDGIIPSVTIDYYVAEATGGETNFTLPYSPIDVDYPIITGRDSIASPYDVLDAADVGEVPPTILNGDQTEVIPAGSSILIFDSQVFSVESVSYDPTLDVTSVVFYPAPEITIKNASLKATDPISNSVSYRVTESSPSDVVEKNGNTLSVSGQRPYKSGMVFFIDDDPYWSTSVSFNQKTGNTDIVMASPATRNYILPEIQYTVRPVLAAGSSFQTANSANVSRPFTLVRGGKNPSVLLKDVDYQLSDGGLVKLTSEVGRGDSLEVMYIYRVVKPVGTNITVNYTSQIAPNQTNGIQGQKLVLSYNLYSPDTFFFRRETVITFIPEVIDELKGSSTSGSSSGPNIASTSSLKLKDMGNPGLYFNEQHLSNVDIVVSRLLKFYNDLINTWEDILSNLDGRVIGGVSGKFRFDGNFSNPPRTSYLEITNDIDDVVQIYTTLLLTGFYVFEEEPVYAHMYEPNSLSRIYPTSTLAIAALNDKTDFTDIFKTMGSFRIRRLTGVGTMSPAPATSEFTTTNGGSVLTIPKNGDPENLVPEFAAGQLVKLYKPDGSLDISTTIVSVTGTFITIDDPTTLRKGGIVQDTQDPNSEHFYTVGSDLNVDNDNGNIINFTLPPILSGLQNPVAGNEIIQSNVTFSNTDMTPKRVPVLDGKLTTDFGRPSVPPLSRLSETSVLFDEIQYLLSMGNARVSGDLITLTDVSLALSVGLTIEFITGPNDGTVAVIATVVNPTTYTVVNPPFVLLSDPTGSDFIVKTISAETFDSIYTHEFDIIKNNVQSTPISGSYIGNVNSELTSIEQVILDFGLQLTSGTGVPSSPSVLVDTLNNFSLVTPSITNSSLLYVTSGPNHGLYKVLSVSSNSVTISNNYPYTYFPSIGSSSPYVIIQPWSFISTIESEVATVFLSKTLKFYDDTVSWYNAPSLTGTQDRLNIVQSRLNDIALFIESISGLFISDDQLYDKRYLFIQQRTDKKDGTLFKIIQSKSQRIDDAKKLAAGQKKLLIAQSLVL